MTSYSRLHGVYGRHLVWHSQCSGLVLPLIRLWIFFCMRLLLFCGTKRRVGHRTGASAVAERLRWVRGNFVCRRPCCAFYYAYHMCSQLELQQTIGFSVLRPGEHCSSMAHGSAAYKCGCACHRFTAKLLVGTKLPSSFVVRSQKMLQNWFCCLGTAYWECREVSCHAAIAVKL